jgi:hypothetical protein
MISGIVELPLRNVVIPTVNTPIRTAFMPSVMMRGFIPNNPTASPLIVPINMQYKVAYKIAKPNPDDDLILTIKAAPVAIIAIERSIPPVSIHIVCPAAKRPNGTASCKVTPIEEIVKK